MEAFFIPIWNPNLISLINRRWSAYQGLLLIYSSKTPIFIMHLQKWWREIARGVEPISVLPVSALLLLTVIWCTRSEMKVLGYKHGGSASEWYGVFLWMQISSGSSLQVSHSTQRIMWEKTTPLHSASWTFQITSKSAFISPQAFSSFQRPCAHLHYSLLCYHAVLLTVTLSSCMEPQNRPNHITLSAMQFLFMSLTNIF